jgi:hypothetical protein
LTLLILEPGSTSEMAVELEQYCLDMLSPKLNVDMVASSSGYHEPMSEEWREYFALARGWLLTNHHPLASALGHQVGRAPIRG